MKTWKLIAGILSMVFFVIVEFQSCAAGVVNTIEDEGGTSGTIGAFCGILLLVGGIVSVATRKAEGKGANIALIIIFGLGGIIGIAGHDNYGDLVIWSIWALLNALIAFIACLKKKKVPQAEAAPAEDK